MMQANRGFILVLVLWVLLALTIAASALAAWISRTTSQAILMADERASLVDVADNLETLKFLAATRPSRVSGLYLGPIDPEQSIRRWADPFGQHRDQSSPNDLPLDDTRLAGLGQISIRIQDEAGLLPLQSLSIGFFSGLLERLGASRLRQDELAERLMEFMLATPQSIAARSLAAEYAAAGLPPPPGRFLIAPLEALRVSGWQDLADVANLERLRDGVSVLHRGQLNVNTAPEWLLAAAPGVNAAGARRIAQGRRDQPIGGGLVVPGGALDPFEFQHLPGNAWRITFNTPSSQRTLRYHLHLTPQSDEHQPWKIELSYPVVLDLESNGVEDSRPEPIAHPLFTEPE